MSIVVKRIGVAARRAFLGLIMAAGLVPIFPGGARAEVKDLTIAIQYGLSYLPWMIARNQGLIEKHVEAQGVGPVKVNWLVLNGGVAANDALLSGATPRSSPPASRRFWRSGTGHGVALA